jgi:hypothetical protein
MPVLSPPGRPAPLERSTTPRGTGVRRSAPLSRVEEVIGGPRVLLALVLVGAVLRLWQYLAGTSLWLDETMLGRNIVELPLGALLTQPLALDQVAPRGFLLVEKIATTLLGNEDWALRLFPLAVGLASLPLFRRLAERALDGLAVPFAVAAFAIGVPFIRYTIEVKQYGADIFATIAIALVAIDLHERDRTRAGLARAALVGVVLLCFSQAAVLVLAGAGAALAVAWLRERDARTGRVLLTVVPVWAVASLAAVVVGERSMTPSTRAFMHDFWRPGFLPLPFDVVRDGLWLWGAFVDPFRDPTLLRYPLPVIGLALAVAGVVWLARRRPLVALVLVAPVLVALLAAVAQRYPFRTRLVLFLLPLPVLMMSAGAEWLRQLGARHGTRTGLALMAAAFLIPAWALVDARMPVVSEQNKEIISWLAQHRQPGDAIYVMRLARPPFYWYGPRYGIKPGEWTPGTCDRNDTRGFVRQLDQFRGRSRVWTVFTGHRPMIPARTSMRRYLQTIGVRRDSIAFRSIVFPATIVELYDLSDAARLSRATAETIEVDPMPTDPRPGCRVQDISPVEELRARRAP